ncbi:hypothetical protein EVJ50_14295 [Synechococcus sp. RSCCF101]|uniref:hypothetical protein n=1 Tax=Synechococcus sp. RSCCF101 TaxID=2511069 RepID=UPI001246AB59|nr:hypothetical protein [Synechococcus sp. RSCCF101]QEY33229.1 hypothetical protein EVJ50_14295 [Synechococcus sp. RSCCF101]
MTLHPQPNRISARSVTGLAATAVLLLLQGCAFLPLGRWLPWSSEGPELELSLPGQPPGPETDVPGEGSATEPEPESSERRVVSTGLPYLRESLATELRESRATLEAEVARFDDRLRTIRLKAEEAAAEAAQQTE